MFVVKQKIDNEKSMCRSEYVALELKPRRQG